MTKLLSRRDVLKGAGSLAAVTASQLHLAPAVLADANPGRKLNVAAIGCGGRGLYMSGLSPELNYVALAEAIGKLLEVHAWHIFADRFGGSMPKPGPESVPKGLDWDAWLGPAKQRPFSAA
jgi:hypothetical protein